MVKIVFALFVFSLSGLVYSDNANISWTIPTTRTDGTQLPANEIDSYILRKDGAIVSDAIQGNETTYIVSGLTPGQYCFDMATKDTEGRIGPFSVAVCRFVRDTPRAPTSIDILIVP